MSTSIPPTAGKLIPCKVKWSTPVGVGTMLMCTAPTVAAHQILCRLERLEDDNLEKCDIRFLVPPGTEINVGTQFTLYDTSRVQVGTGITEKKDDKNVNP